MTAFARPSLIHDRYAVIAETSVYTYDDDDLVNYGQFLQKHSRYMSNKGDADPNRLIRSVHQQQDGLFSMQRPSRSAPSSPTAAKTFKSSTDHVLPAIGSRSMNVESRKRDHDKQVKSIEKQMMQVKQKERETKQQERDVWREQRAIRHSLQGLNVDTNKKRYDSERQLSQNLQEKDHLEKDFVKKREKQTKQRTDHAVDSLQTNKDKDRHNLLVCHDLARQYRSKANELNVKHLQLHRLHSDFEQKVQQRELERNRMKKELKDIAVALSLEAQKAKNEMKDVLHAIDQERSQSVKSYSDKQRKLGSNGIQVRIHYADKKQSLSADAATHRAMLDRKQHEALRRIGETKSRLEVLTKHHRPGKPRSATLTPERDQRSASSRSRTDDVDGRSRDPIRRSETRDASGSGRSRTRYSSLEAKQHEDHLRHFQAMLRKNQAIEYELRKSVKEAEFQRRRKEKEVEGLREDLIRKKRDDAKKIHDAIARAEDEEKQLHRHLVREKTKLDDLLTRRDNSQSRLSSDRDHRRETRALRDTHEREHVRLLRAQSRSQSLRSLNSTI